MAPFLSETLISACLSFHLLDCEPRKLGLGVGQRNMGLPVPPGSILETGHRMQGRWEVLGGRGGGVWPSGSQSNALPSPPRFLCCSLHAFSVCVTVYLELWFSYFFFFFSPFGFFFYFLYCVHPPSIRPSIRLCSLHPPDPSDPCPPWPLPVAMSPTSLPPGGPLPSALPNGPPSPRSGLDPLAILSEISKSVKPRLASFRSLRGSRGVSEASGGGGGGGPSPPSGRVAGPWARFLPQAGPPPSKAPPGPASLCAWPCPPRTLGREEGGLGVS